MAIQRAVSGTVTFELVDSSNRPNLKTGVVFVAGDSRIKKDAGSFANTTNLPTETNESGVYELVLTAAERNAEWIHCRWSKAGTDGAHLRIGTSGLPSGSIVSNGSNSSTTFKTDLASTTNDQWKDVYILFTTGALAGQLKKVTGYDGSTKFITTSTAFTGTPSAGDLFVLVNI